MPGSSFGNSSGDARGRLGPARGPRWVTPALAAVAIGLTACASSSRTASLDDPEPMARVDAMRAVAARGDRTPDTLRRLVEQLDSDDPLVRLVAITVLEDLTGERYGYEPDAPPREREAAIERWVETLPSPEGQSARMAHHHG